ncbi:Aste57867_21036 [Aphanomyces stellatus]|uniref:E3 ubiquitin-protein ligase n=1 Tax=Aphanomyces stellatus TaxID=120398 RepID=A0A485LH33_9STRA|nr:hypothetical protein As57867_020968 [Aphanomyces stellatus]VFT97711.1 Aste57867_21036 [Aphanomyces stellatus]
MQVARDEVDDATDLAVFAQLFFLASVDEPSCDAQDLLRGLDILLTCLVDAGGKQKKQAPPKKESKHRASLLPRSKPRDVMANPVFARLVAKKRRKVCGYIFKSDEVAYSCRDCQHDSTCVMCQACFADSNHEGHDVSFQRTSAGGCCDCGDAEAWAKSGFCTKHPGRDDTKKSSVASELPKPLGSMAEPLIEVVVKYLYDALVSAEQAMIVAVAMEALGHRVSPDTLEQWKQEGSKAAENATSDADKSKTLRYDVRLHSDDIHPFSDVVKALKAGLGFTKSKAVMVANQSDADGLTSLGSTSLVHAAAMVHSLHGYTTSVAPHGLYDMKRIHVLLEWLRSLCEISDSLALLVSASVEARRAAAPSHTSSIVRGHALATTRPHQTIGQFLKQFKMAPDAVDFLSSTLPLQMKLAKWAHAIPVKQPPTTTTDKRLPGCLGDLLADVERTHAADTATCAQVADEFAVEPTDASLLDLLVRNYCLLGKPAIHQVNLFFHELILNQSLKHAMMDAFVDAYPHNTQSYLKGLGSTSDSIFDFATQLLTVPSLLSKYPKTLVTTLLTALSVVLDTAMGTRAKEDGTTCKEFRPDNAAISHSKYKHAADHLEFVLSHGNPLDLIGNDANFGRWMQCLSVLQFADAQIRRNRDEPHVEYESDSWFSTFNLGIKLHALFPLMLQGLTLTGAMDETNAAALLQRVMAAIGDHTASSLAVTTKSARAVAADNDTLYVASESNVVLLENHVPRVAASLHIPLHRFVSAMLKQVLVLSKDPIEYAQWQSFFNISALSTEQLVLLMDAPLKCLAMSSQIQANLWRRNGDENMVTQLFNYCAMPYCVNFRDADLFLLQVGVLLLGAEHMVALIVDRFDLHQYFELPNAPSTSDLFDDEQELQMVEEALRLLLTLATNVPSSTGAVYEDEFLREELLHQLLVRPSTFSELSDNVSLPLGGHDMGAAPISRLEPLLEQVASFQTPIGLEPGKYTIRTNCIEHCNPYHLHLNRELHEVAREKILERSNAVPPFVPLASPLQHLAAVQSLLLTPSTVHMVYRVLDLRRQKDSKRWSEALLSTSLDVLVFGIQMAPRDSDYWTLVARLMQPLTDIELLVDKEQRHAIEWLLKEFPRRSSACAAALKKPTGGASSSQAKENQEMDLQARKNEAKARAMAAMAKKMAAFSQLMEEDDEEMEEKAAAGGDKRSREGSVEDEPTSAKKWKPTCMLCHDPSSTDELCMVAMVQHSTVLSTGFRPSSTDALDPEKGPKTREDIEALIQAMQLQSRGDGANSHHHHHHHHLGGSPTGHRVAFADLFWDMANDSDEGGGGDASMSDDENDEEDELDNLPPPPRLPEGIQEDEMARALGGAIQEAMRLIPRRRRRQFGFRVRTTTPAPEVNAASEGMNLVPVGLFVRTCQHIVHMSCVDTYISTLHEKAMRGEEFDGMQAVDPDASMTQFLCPMCKTLCNVLVPMIEPNARVAGRSQAMWHAPAEHPGNWIQPLHQTHENQETLDTWKDYYEDALWEPHGSFEKGAPYLWSACAYTVAATLAEADVTEPGFVTWPASLEKEYASMQALVTFTRWSFAMVHLTGDSKVIYETVKRCCPVVQESKREYRKYTKMIGNLDACIRGTVLGLLVADTFTAFVVTMVAAESIDVIGQLIPIFSAADMLQRLGRAFFVSERQRAASFYQDVPKDDMEPTSATTRMQTRTKISSTQSTTAKDPQALLASHTKSLQKLKRLLGKASTHAGALHLVMRMCEMDATLRLKPALDLSQLDAITELNALLVRRMHVVYGCLTSKEASLPTPPPSFRDVSEAPLAALQQIWEWCVIRKASQMELGAASQDATNRCEHAEQSSEAYLANMFILRDRPRHDALALVALPAQYDDLYSHHVNMTCRRCKRVPREPGLCLVCGELLCCGESCCSYTHVKNNPSMGECTRHAFECGGGLGLVLMLQQCRVVLVAGSMTAYFPSPYVDSHGEEDPGLQRGRPLKLDTNRYQLLESLWRSHRLHAEVSRLRNQRESQQPLNLTYI